MVPSTKGGTKGYQWGGCTHELSESYEGIKLQIPRMLIFWAMSPATIPAEPRLAPDVSTAVQYGHAQG